MIRASDLARPLLSRRALSAVVAGLLTLAISLIAATAAMAKPKGEFAVFASCPLKVAGVNECVYSQTTGGELRFGKMTVPIKNTITLQGGLIITEKEETFVNPSEGVALSKTAEEVPGGFESSPLTLTLELVGSVVLSKPKLAEGKGVALTLPVRGHLKNIFLGEECFIGSSTKPITLNLTTGTTSPPAPNKPITGLPGTHEVKEEGTLDVFKGDSLVDNAFSVPAAAGCGTLVTPVINSKFGLPAAAGNNTAIMSGTSKFATAEAVIKSE